MEYAELGPRPLKSTESRSKSEACTRIGASLCTLTGSLGFGFELKRRIFWQPAGELISDLLVGRVTRNVVELVRIVLMVVEFLCPVFIDNQSPVAAADRVIAKVRRRDRGLVAWCCGII